MFSQARRRRLPNRRQRRMPKQIPLKQQLLSQRLEHHCLHRIRLLTMFRDGHVVRVLLRTGMKMMSTMMMTILAIVSVRYTRRSFWPSSLLRWQLAGCPVARGCPEYNKPARHQLARSSMNSLLAFPRQRRQEKSQQQVRRLQQQLRLPVEMLPVELLPQQQQMPRLVRSGQPPRLSVPLPLQRTQHRQQLPRQQQLQAQLRKRSNSRRQKHPRQLPRRAESRRSSAPARM
mmetsp:Transcript_65738/g.119934  ORF Transcript_65738/g.119934 Transcript_65738/m.119934 type:complete len:231 (-) Transcript_65738:1157-1849(-)